MSELRAVRRSLLRKEKAQTEDTVSLRSHAENRVRLHSTSTIAGEEKPLLFAFEGSTEKGVRLNLPHGSMAMGVPLIMNRQGQV